MLRPGTQDTFISSRVMMPTAKSHAELVRDVEPKIRAQAFFSARVAEAHILEKLRAVSDGYSRGEMSLGEARNTLKDFLRAEGYDPHQAGLRNLASTARLNLILKQNAAMAHAAAEWKRMHDPAAMKVFPYVRYHARQDRRTRDSHSRLDGKIFRKDDPFLWTHTPPWEFNCRCWLEEITGKAAEREAENIQPPTPPENVRVDSESGFSFDPEHAFERYDMSAIKDPETRANVMDYMTDRFSEQTRELYRDNAAGYLEGKAAEMQRRVQAEASEKVFPGEPKAMLTGETRKRAEEQARRAVPPGTMSRVDEAVRKLGEDEMEPFMHYSGRPKDSENRDIRRAMRDGVIAWNMISDRGQKRIHALQALLDKMPKFHGTLYRGCTFDSEDRLLEYLKTLAETPQNLGGFISATPDPVVAHHYATLGRFPVMIVIPNSREAVYFGPYSKHPEDEEALLSYKFYLKTVEKYKKDGIVYVMAEVIAR